MNFFQELFSNIVFVSAALGWLIAQVIKTIIHLILTRKFVFERLVGSGGMPSSHSATVCALATSACITYGPGSFEFAISLIMAIIVMYDARGVRYETQKQAMVLNDLVRIIDDMTKKEISVEQKLKEFVGHTPLQVFVGAVLGILIAIVVTEISLIS